MTDTLPETRPHPATPCREYQGPRTTKGYGRSRIGGRQVLLHRWILEQGEGRPLEPGEVAMHSCDNPPCFLFEHLSRGTQSDNLKDAVRKGRARYVAHKGEANGQAILTAEQVLDIRARYVPGTSPHHGNARDLAVEFGVTVRTIQSVVWRQKWKHL